MVKRHLHFVQAIDPARGGGLGQAALSLHRAFLELQVPSTLATTRRRGELPPTGESLYCFARHGVDKFFWSPAMRRQSTSLVATADIVHGHGFYVYPNWLLGRETARQGKPLVYHVHGIFEPWILGRSRWKKRAARTLFEDGNFEYAAAWRALTEREAEQIRNLGIKAPIIVVPNGIDPAEFSDPDLGVLPRGLPDDPFVLFLGRLHPNKGLDLLLSAWGQTDAPSRGWRLVIAGPDEVGWKHELVARSEELAAGSVLFLPAVYGPSKVALLNRADALVLPSRSEGFALTPLEALASGTPVVVSDRANLTLPESPHIGWLTGIAPEELAATLEEVTRATPADLAALGETGRRWVASEYSLSATARAFLDQLGQVLGL